MISPSSEERDQLVKLEEYFQIPSVMHYVIVLDDRRRVIHHRRADAGVIETRLLSDGALDLTPPGLSVAVEALLGPPENPA